MYVANPQAQPGIQGPFISQPRQIFYSGVEFAQYIAPPIVIDGFLSSNTANIGTPGGPGDYRWLLWAGQLFGRETSTNYYRNSILGLTTGALVSGSTSIQTDAGTASEVARLISYTGGSITLNITGPPSASTTVAATVSTVVTATAATGTTITISGTVGASVISGALIQPNDGSQNILFVLAEDQGVRIQDQLQNRYNAQTSRMACGGGTINTGYLVWYPTDVGLELYIKSKLQTNAPSLTFLDNII